MQEQLPRVHCENNHVNQANTEIRDDDVIAPRIPLRSIRLHGWSTRHKCHPIRLR